MKVINNEESFESFRIFVQFLKHSFITTLGVIVHGWVKNITSIQRFALSLGHGQLPT